MQEDILYDRMKQPKTYLLAGASSSMAQATITKLSSEGHKIITISRKHENSSTVENDQYFIENYDFNKFPVLNTPLNGLVYFPGTINLKPFTKLTETDFKNDLSIHLLGAIAFIQTYLPLLEKDPTSSIVLISSVAATLGMPYHTSVSVSKSAVEGLVRSLATELTPSIRINAIAPSLVKTSMGERFINTQAKQEAIEKQNPMRKIGTPEEIANAIHFLLSENSSWITGQVIAVDGGMNNLKV